MPEQIKRPNYFNFQFLDENDFKYEQDYHRNLRQEHLLALHGWGVVGDGLQVSQTSNPEGGVPSVTISPGVAADKQGREIFLHEPRTAPLRSAGGTEVYLSVKWTETTEESDRYTGSGFAGRNVYRRLTLRPEFDFTTTQPDENSDNILLARIGLNDDGTIRNIDPSVRQYASSWIAPNATLPGPLNIGDALSVTGNSGTVFSAGVSPQSTANIDLSGHIQLKEYGTDELAYLQAMDKDSNRNIGLQIRTQTRGTNAPNLVEALRITHNGNVGIGTTNPGSSKLRISNSISDFTDISFSGSGMGQLQIIGWSSGWNINTMVNGKHLYLNRDSFENSDVYIGRVGQELFVRGRDGKVGIGTTNPSQKLTIQADYNAADDDAKQLLIQGNTNSNNQLALGYHTTKNYGSIQAVTRGEPFLTLQEGRNLVLNPFGGNVGIGTTNPAGSLDVQGSVYIGTGRNGENHKLAIRGPNQPGNSGSFQDLSYEFASAGSVRIRAFRGESWDTYLQFLTNPVTAGRDNPQVSLHINHNGNVGIGTTGPTGKLTVVGSEGAGRSVTIDNREIKFRGDGASHFSIFANRWRDNILTIENTSSNAFSTVAGTVLLALNSDGRLEVRGQVIASVPFSSSDVRWKKNIETIASALDKVLQLRGVTFEWRKEEYQEMNFNPGKHLGLIAQEVEKVIPEVVYQNEEGYKSLAYSNLVALLIEALKELQAKHENLLPTMQAQQAEIEGLKAELSSLKALLIAQPV